MSSTSGSRVTVSLPFAPRRFRGRRPAGGNPFVPVARTYVAAPPVLLDVIANRWTVRCPVSREGLATIPLYPSIRRHSNPRDGATPPEFSPHPRRMVAETAWTADD